jgi:dihydrofolate reductase
MRKVIASEFVSLDGVIENPVWTFRFTSGEQQRFKHDELSAADALLLGRVTYEGFAPAWPHMTEQAGEYTDRRSDGVRRPADPHAPCRRPVHVSARFTSEGCARSRTTGSPSPQRSPTGR